MDGEFYEFLRQFLLSTLRLLLSELDKVPLYLWISLFYSHIVTGTLVNVKSSRKSMTTQQDFVQVDTTDILFIASGAFTALDRIVGKRLDKKTLGLGYFH